MRQMTIFEYVEKQQAALDGVKAAILRAMERAAAEEQQYGLKVFPLFPHDVVIYIEEEEWIRHHATIRRHMAAMARRGVIRRVGQRKGYKLAS